MVAPDPPNIPSLARALLKCRVRVVLPGETDAAVDLDVLRRTEEVRLRAVYLRHRGRLVPVRRPRRRRPRGVVARRARRLRAQEHVRAPVLHRLEGPDRPPELHPRLRVLDRHLQAALGAAHLLRRERHAGERDRLLQRGPRGALLAEPRRGRHPRAVEPHLRLPPRHVHRRQRAPRHAGHARRHGEQAHPLGPDRPRGARRDEDQVGRGTVDHEGLRAVEHVVAAALAHVALPRRRGHWWPLASV